MGKLDTSNILYGDIGVRNQWVVSADTISGDYKGWKPSMYRLGLNRTYSGAGWVGNESWQAKGMMPKQWFWSSSKPLSESAAAFATHLIAKIEDSLLAIEPRVRLGQVETACTVDWRRVCTQINPRQIDLYVNASFLQAALIIARQQGHRVQNMFLFEQEQRIAAINDRSEFIFILKAVKARERSADI